MKKLIAMATAILFTAGVSAFASGTNPYETPSKRINYQLSFTRIELNDDIDLVLQESADKFMDITGKATDIDNVDWKIKGGVLYIRSKKGSLKDKVKVSLAVNQLKKLEIYGQSNVTSMGQLNSATLLLSIEGDSYVSLKNTGQIRVVNSPNTQLDFRRVVGEVIVSK